MNVAIIWAGWVLLRHGRVMQLLRLLRLWMLTGPRECRFNFSQCEFSFIDSEPLPHTLQSECRKESQLCCIRTAMVVCVVANIYVGCWAVHTRVLFMACSPHGRRTVTLFPFQQIDKPYPLSIFRMYALLMVSLCFQNIFL